MTAEEWTLPTESYNEYTVILCNSRPSLFAAKTLVFFLFYCVGAIQGYQVALVLELQEKGATYEDQSNLTIAFYPYMFKLLFAPMIDLYFIKFLGKCKTYIVTTGVILSLISLYLAGNETLIDRKHISHLTFVYFNINVVVSFFQIAAEMWILKLFEGDNKAKGTMFMEMGNSVGVFSSYHLFVPLNSVRWLNTHIFTTNPLSRPIVSHSMMQLVLAVMFAVISMYVLCFMGELREDPRKPRPTFRSIVSVVPKFVSNRNMRNLLLFIGATRVFRSAISESLILKLIDNGIPKTTIVNIDTLVFPLGIISGCFMIKFLVKGKLMKFYYWISALLLLMSSVWYLMLYDLQQNKDSNRTKVFLIIHSCFRTCLNAFPFALGYINQIAIQEIGSTYISIFLAYWNFLTHFPQTIGLRLVNNPLFSYETLVLAILALQACSLILYVNHPAKLDLLGKEEYLCHYQL